jgi:hypothetical protein
MVQARNDFMKDYWKTDPTISTAVFPEVLSKMTNLKAYGKHDILVMVTNEYDSGRLYKTQPVSECCLQKFS